MGTLCSLVGAEHVSVTLCCPVELPAGTANEGPPPAPVVAGAALSPPSLLDGLLVSTSSFSSAGQVHFLLLLPGGWEDNPALLVLLRWSLPPSSQLSPSTDP